MNYLAERRQEEKERRRADILDAAEQVTRAVGWDELTMEQVARRVRLSRALLYVYFQDKTDLMFGICERGLILLKQRFEQAAARHHTGLDQITAIGRAYIAFSQELPVYFDILARCEMRDRDLQSGAGNQAACVTTGDSVHALMVQIIQRGLADGSIRADLGSPLLAAMTLWGFVHGVIQLAHVKGKLLAYHGVDVRNLLEQSISMATRSMAARA